MADKNDIRSDLHELNVNEVAEVSGAAANNRSSKNLPWAVFDLDTGDIGVVGCGGMILLNGKVYVGGYNGPVRVG